MPVRANVPTPVSALRSSEPATAGLTTELAGAKPLSSQARATPGAALLSAAYDSRWHARGGGRTLAHSRTFGWANGWDVAWAETVQLGFAGQLARNLEILLQALLWLGACAAWWFTRRRTTRVKTIDAELPVKEPAEPVLT
jgi:hypothetical protein